jgi:hypothetical protein
MWFTKEHFELCNQLRLSGLEPRFEPGDVVARGFADLGFEEFQVLPGPSILSLTAGTAKPLPPDHQHHFFWIPSVDESIELIEASGYELASCARQEMRDWLLSLSKQDLAPIQVIARDLHGALLKALLVVYQGSK